MVKNLPLKRFKWRDEVYSDEQVVDRRKIGWIAQDVESVFPKAVNQYEFKYNQKYEDEIIPAVEGRDAVECITSHAKKIAKEVDDSANSLTLRLRNLSGVIKLAGYMASMNKNDLISKEDVLSAIEKSRSIEERIQERYGSSWRAGAADYSVKTNKENKDIR